ncbi:uncharacterized protein mute isoform X2 [Prorops nasuta]|uniref:uncharacterized protein mute isoform X2 n=1 Tax=Prorops nasuta TaxID=863751 RepID=UPI0034CE1789
MKNGANEANPDQVDSTDNKMEKNLNSSTKKSPQNSNLSFSLNFDFDDVNSGNSTDSETAHLQIDVSEVDKYELFSKKRESMEEVSVIDEMVVELERQLDAKAAKTNLTATNVKNILKHVITNEHVMVMVQGQLKETQNDVLFEPKLTRAKAKQLAVSQLNVPWSLTPLKTGSSEVQALIEEELPEDSSDEEYNPYHDKYSDDDRDGEHSIISDIDSQPSTPRNLDENAIEPSKYSNNQYDSDGLFKIPSLPHLMSDEESIGQRTRSKLSLSETPLEHIEQAFVPPDITTDMYDWDFDADEDWNNFLKEFTQPLVQDHILEDDPDADPEYNILDDEETDTLDKEELRADKAVKVTRKELNNLIAELFEFTDTFSRQNGNILTTPKKKRSDNFNSSVENNSLSCSMIDLLPALAEPDLPKLVSFEQRQLLAIQFQQHVQLIAQHFAMTYMHPELHPQAKTCKDNLISLRYLSNGPNSAFNVSNLQDALNLVSAWEHKFVDTKFFEKFKEIVTEEMTVKKIYQRNKYKYIPRFPPELEELFVESKALMYPQLLPEMPFNAEHTKYVKTPYFKSEENLIALGLEQFFSFAMAKQKKYKSKNIHLMDTAQLIAQYLLPCREPRALFNYINKCRRCKVPNPIKHYFEKGQAPRTIHVVTLDFEIKAPKDQPKNLSLRWQNYLGGASKSIDTLKRKYILKSFENEQLHSINNRYNKLHNEAFISHPLRNPIVNMLPKIVTAAEDSKIANNDKTMDNKKEINSQVSTESENKTNKDTELPNEKNLNALLPVQSKKREEEMDHLDQESGIISADDVQPKKSNSLSPMSQQRKTTPRLAKLRSVQNLKLMTQMGYSKNISQTNATKSKDKSSLQEKSENEIAGRVDNEEDIAELMLASTTIKKDSVSRKKAKEARELENIKRLLKAENVLQKMEKDSKFAVSYLQKLHLILELNNPEILKSVIRLYLEFNEKVDQMENEISLNNKSVHTKGQIETILLIKDKLIVNLYHSICKQLQDYPELCTEFLLFLKPHQAAMINKSIEYTMLQKMSEFVDVVQIYFAKQPAKLAKMMQAITQLAADAYVSLDTVNKSIGPILKGHPLVMDLFLQILPTGKPPERLLAPCLFENLAYPLGPHDKNKICIEGASELFENLELSAMNPLDDRYGGDNCKCSCHKLEEETLKGISEHCLSCGLRFLNGRIYLQTLEGLRPAKITFPGPKEDELSNITRISLKSTDKYFPVITTKGKQKSSKNYLNQDEILHKKCNQKSCSNWKEINEIISNVSKKLGHEENPLKRPRCPDDAIVYAKKICSSPVKSKREKKIEISEMHDEKNTGATVSKYELCLSSDTLKLSEKNNITYTEKKVNLSNVNNPCVSISESKMVKDRKDLGSKRKSASSDIKCKHKTKTTDVKPWTREEDMILLLNIKKEYSEDSFVNISKLLENRTVKQVKERCQTLLGLLANKA